MQNIIFYFIPDFGVKCDPDMFLTGLMRFTLLLCHKFNVIIKAVYRKKSQRSIQEWIWDRSIDQSTEFLSLPLLYSFYNHIRYIRCWRIVEVECKCLVFKRHSGGEDFIPARVTPLWTQRQPGSGKHLRQHCQQPPWCSCSCNDSFLKEVRHTHLWPGLLLFCPIYYDIIVK